MTNLLACDTRTLRHPIDQLAEHMICNLEVTGSIPVGGLPWGKGPCFMRDTNYCGLAIALAANLIALRS